MPLLIGDPRRNSGRTVATTTTMYRYENGRTYRMHSTYHYSCLTQTWVLMAAYRRVPRWRILATKRLEAKQSRSNSVRRILTL
jgi:hypothetical protein